MAIADVSWQATSGRSVCLLGHSGCGKTTLLRLIAGIERPASGSIMIGGEEVSGPDRFVAPEQRRIGLVFQDYALFPHLTVLDNVLFGLRGRDRAASRATALLALERVHMAHHASSYPHTLSGGEQQRVALARALAPQPRLVLMDEPFSNLDRRLRDQVRDETMALLRDSGTTTVIVTHDPEEALRIGDQIVLLHEGRVEQCGTPEQVWSRPASLFAARFFSDLNEIPARCQRGAAATPFGRIHAAGHADGARLRLCLRPRDLRLTTRPGAVRGRVTERLFLGDAEQLRIAVSGVDQPLLLRRPSAGDIVVGDEVGLEIAPGAALLFADRD
jgi:iron(III) transport system ATP-binding protein